MRSAVLAAAAALISFSVASAAPSHRAAQHRHRLITASRVTSGECRNTAGVPTRCGPAATTDIEGVPIGAKARCSDGAYSARGPGGMACEHRDRLRPPRR